MAGRVDVFDAQGIESETTDLGETPLGAPVRIARRVAEADLAVTVGVVEPHLYAGFSGGVKGVAIGCAGRETIAWTHRPAFISAPGVTLCRLRGNPFQATLRDIAARTPLRWGVNLTMAAGGASARVRAGDPAAVQEALAGELAGTSLREVGERFDAVVVGVHAPKSDNLYQASRAATSIGLAARPAVAEGGLIVLCAGLPDGAGDGPGERNCLARARRGRLADRARSSEPCASRSAPAASGRSSSPACSSAFGSPSWAPPTPRSSSRWSTSGWPRSTPSTRPSPPRTRGSAAAPWCSPSRTASGRSSTPDS